MKTLAAASVLACIFISCTKEPAKPIQTPPETHTSIITSATLYYPEDHHLTIDSFEYDDHNRIKNSYSISLDSSTVPAYSGITKNVFNYIGNDSMPASVTIGTDQHILEYNEQKMITKDSVTNLYTYLFSYANNTVYTTLILPPNIGTYKDTITFQNENMVSKEYWFFMPNTTQHISSSFTYSSLVNPLHNLQHMGLLLYTLGGLNRDYLSLNLASSLMVNGSLVSTTNWTSSDGQVTGGTESYGSGHLLVSTFRYK